MNDRGRIQAGMRADLLLVEGDPSKQIRDTRNIVAIWKRGVRARVISPLAIIAVSASASASQPERVAIHIISSQPRKPNPIASVPNSTFSKNAHSQLRSVLLRSWGE